MSESMKLTPELQNLIDVAVAAGIKRALELQAEASAKTAPVQNDLAQYSLNIPHFNGVELLAEGTVVTLPDSEEPAPDWIPMNAKAELITAKVRGRAAALNRLQMAAAAKIGASTLTPEMAKLVDESLEESLAEVKAEKMDPARDPAFDRRPLGETEVPKSGPTVVPPAAPAPVTKSARRPRASDAEI